MKKIGFILLLFSSIFHSYSQRDVENEKYRDSLLAESDFLIRVKKYDKALETVKTLQEAFAEEPLVYVLFVQIYLAKKDYELVWENSIKGIDLYKLKKQDNSENEFYLFLLSMSGSVASAIGKCKEGIIYLNEYLSYSNDEWDVYCDRAICHNQMGELSKAIDDCHKAYLLDPNNTTIMYFYGELLFHKQEFEKAIPLLVQASKDKNTSPEVFREIGMAYFQTKRYNESITYFDLYINNGNINKNHASYADALYRRSQSHFYLGNYFESASFMTIYMNREESEMYDVEDYYLTIQSLIMTNDLLNAFRHNEQALVKFPNEGYFNQAAATLSYLFEQDVTLSGYHVEQALIKSTEVSNIQQFYDELCKVASIHIQDVALFYSILDTAILKTPELSFFQERKVFAMSVSPESPKKIDRLFVYARRDEIVPLLSDIIEKNCNDREKQAYYFSIRAMIFSYVNEFDSAFQAISKAIELHEFNEYYAFRSELKVIQLFHIYNGDLSLIPNFSKSEILSDINKAIELSQDNFEFMFIKIKILVHFNDVRNACVLIKELEKSGYNVPNNLRNQVCKKRVKVNINHWKLNYTFSNWFSR